MALWWRSLSFAILVLTLEGSIAWGQEVEEQLHLELTVEVGLFAHSPPELNVRTTLRRGDWNLQLAITRSLAQTPSVRIQLAERLQYGSWGIGMEFVWEPSAGIAAQLELKAQSAIAQLHLGVQVPPVAWTAQGTLQRDDLHLQITGLRWQNNVFTLQKAELRWTPQSNLNLTAQLDNSKPLPLHFEIAADLLERLQVSWISRFEMQDDSSWIWREADLVLTRDRLQGGLSVSHLGWQEVWIERSERFGGGLDLKGRVRLGPMGWLSTELEGRWGDPLGGSIQADLGISPSGWQLLADASRLNPNLTLQGKLGLNSGRISNLMLLGRAMQGTAQLDGLFNYTGSFWLLNLSGSLSWETWTLNASSSWRSLLGWEKGSFGITREFDL